jgi:sec-independent protein translocase protein TatA
MELLVVLVIVIVIFGPKQLPKLGKMLGSSIKNFKKGMEDENTAEDKPDEEQKES